MNFTIFNKTLNLFWSHISKNKTAKIYLFFAVLIVLLDVLVTGLLPKLSKNIVDAFSQPLVSGLGTLAVLLGLCWTLEKILHSVQEVVFFPVINVCIRDVQLAVISHLHKISFLDFQHQSIPEILSCIKRISQSARSFLKITLLMLIPSLLKVFVLTVLILKTSEHAQVVLLTLGLASMILYQGTCWYVKERESAWQITDNVMMKISDSINNTKIIRPFLNSEIQNLKEIFNTEANLWQKSNFKLHFVPMIIGLIFGISLVLILISALQAVSQNRLTAGEFIMLKAQFIALYLPFRSFAQECRQLAESLIDIKKIMILLNLKSEISDPAVKPITLNNIQLELKNISFGYTPQQRVLDNISIKVQAQEKIAIIGKNGSGKSSLMGVLSGLLKPTQGTIYLNDQDLQNRPMHSMHKIIHMIPQDFRVFNTSLRENLQYGSGMISEEKLLEVIHCVELDHLLKHLPHGLETRLGEFGIRLSGGEKQKLALGRALLLKPSILILDETLHALTTESEATLLKTLYNHIPIVIIASQRASVLQHVNRIFFMEDGKLSEISENPSSVFSSLIWPTELKEMADKNLITEHAPS